MRARTTTFRRWAGLPVALLMLGLVALLGASSATAGTNKTIIPSPMCYFDNGDGTVTVNVSIENTNTFPVTIAAGSGENKFNPSPDVRAGQPSTFEPGVVDNAWAVVLTSAEFPSVKWHLAGVDYKLYTTTKCSVTTVTAEGNLLATVLFGAVVTVVGALAMGERRRRRSGPEPA